MEKGIVDVQMMEGPTLSCSQGKQAANIDNLAVGEKVS
jgi:hypothetical protein